MCRCWCCLENIIFFPLSQCLSYNGLPLIFEKNSEYLYLKINIFSNIQSPSEHWLPLGTIDFLCPSLRFLSTCEQNFICATFKGNPLRCEFEFEKPWIITGYRADQLCFETAARFAHTCPHSYRLLLTWAAEDKTSSACKGGLQFEFSPLPHHLHMLTASLALRDNYKPSQRLVLLQSFWKSDKLFFFLFLQELSEEHSLLIYSSCIVWISVLSVWLLLLPVFNF